jgi:hypothetical protein
MTDFRALCAELLAGIDEFATVRYTGEPFYQLIDRARLELDKPEEEGAPVAWLYDGDPWFDGNTWVKEWAVTTDKRLAQFKAEPSEPIPLYRYSRPAPAPKPIPVSERLPEDGDCLVIPPLEKSTYRRFCWQAREIMHCGQARLIWDWGLVPLTTAENWPFTYWLPASTQFLPTTVDSDQST